MQEAEQELKGLKASPQAFSPGQPRPTDHARWLGCRGTCFCRQTKAFQRLLHRRLSGGLVWFLKPTADTPHLVHITHSCDGNAEVVEVLEIIEGREPEHGGFLAGEVDAVDHA